MEQEEGNVSNSSLIHREKQTQIQKTKSGPTEGPGEQRRRRNVSNSSVTHSEKQPRQNTETKNQKRPHGKTGGAGCGAGGTF